MVVILLGFKERGFWSMLEMETNNNKVRFLLGKQSSMAPDRQPEESATAEDGDEIDPRVRLMYLANEGDLEGIRELLDSGIDVNFRDIDNRTALHVAACQGYSEIVDLLLRRGAEIDPKDRWGSTVICCSAFHFLAAFTFIFYFYFFQFIEKKTVLIFGFLARKLFLKANCFDPK